MTADLRSLSRSQGLQTDTLGAPRIEYGVPRYLGYGGRCARHTLRDLVKAYLFARLENDPASWLTVIDGIGGFVSQNEVDKFTDPLVRTICNSRQPGASREAQERLEVGWMIMPNGVDQQVMKRIDQWISHYHEKQLETCAERIEQVKASMESRTVPF